MIGTLPVQALGDLGKLRRGLRLVHRGGARRWRRSRRNRARPPGCAGTLRSFRARAEQGDGDALAGADDGVEGAVRALAGQLDAVEQALHRGEDFVEVVLEALLSSGCSARARPVALASSRTWASSRRAWLMLPSAADLAAEDEPVGRCRRARTRPTPGGCGSRDRELEHLGQPPGGADGGTAEFVDLPSVRSCGWEPCRCKALCPE